MLADRRSDHLIADHRSHRWAQIDSSHHRNLPADHTDGHRLTHRTIAIRPQITQIDADSIEPSQGCIAKNAKIIHRKEAQRHRAASDVLRISGGRILAPERRQQRVQRRASIRTMF